MDKMTNGGERNVRYRAEEGTATMEENGGMDNPAADIGDA